MRVDDGEALYGRVGAPMTEKLMRLCDMIRPQGPRCRATPPLTLLTAQRTGREYMYLQSRDAEYTGCATGLVRCRLNAYIPPRGRQGGAERTRRASRTRFACDADLALRVLILSGFCNTGIYYGNHILASIDTKVIFCIGTAVLHKYRKKAGSNTST